MIKYLYVVVSKGLYHNIGRRQLSSIKVYENARSHPSGTKNCKVSMHTLVTTAHLVRPVLPNINMYPMGESS